MANELQRMITHQSACIPDNTLPCMRPTTTVRAAVHKWGGPGTPNVRPSRTRPVAPWRARVARVGKRPALGTAELWALLDSKTHLVVAPTLREYACCCGAAGRVGGGAKFISMECFWLYSILIHSSKLMLKIPHFSQVRCRHFTTHSAPFGQSRLFGQDNSPSDC
ncbi:hypothetical protein A0H81_02778 [Grifola frondosa]|uniref:Uncharacterized protein n=1 Tax=Grifola frondosa TaxID=5627 RepID=A0A1C7MNY6_GRIFR|nr:hypothetical protein A0H81_02778 [Grifola frondosa]